MTRVARQTRATVGFPPLPLPETAEGTARRIGVEVELSGLDEARVAEVLAEALGGTVEQSGPCLYSLCGSEIGDLSVELDTALRTKTDRPLVQEGLDLARAVIPVEVISAPIKPDALVRLDAALAALRAAGARGSGQGVFYGFGVHLNVEIVAPDHPATLAIPRAYALLEEHLRAEDRIDGTRRILPFVDRWPPALVDALAEARQGRLTELMPVYARNTTSRNHGLDLLPLFKHLDPERFEALFHGGSGGIVKARPTFHFRLPDSRIDEADWSLSRAWSDWHLVESLAADSALLEHLAKGWQAHRAHLLSTRGDWRRQLRAELAQAGLGA
jgi:hypothetical protein